MSLEEAISALAQQPGVVIGLDFDGTLAPIVSHPEDARPDPRAIELITRLARSPRCRVVVVSGRARDDLETRLGPIPGVELIGEHGNDYGGEATADPVLDEARPLVARLAAEYEGAITETKPRSVSLHYRNMEETDAGEALTRIRDWAAGKEGITVLEGKQVIELTTRKGTKGDAIARIAGNDPIVYVGDNTTDETVFEILGPDDIGIKVGEGPTAARYRVDDIAGVVDVLERLTLIFG